VFGTVLVGFLEFVTKSSGRRLLQTQYACTKCNARYTPIDCKVTASYESGRVIKALCAFLVLGVR
jgi:hypothetical protein